MFNINVKILSRWLLPWFLRTAELKAMLYALVTGIQNVYNDLNNYRNKKKYELSIIPSVIWHEKLLNDKYDALHRRIYITEYFEDYSVYVYNESDNQISPYTYNHGEAYPQEIWLFNDSQGPIQNYFIVHIPNQVWLQLLANNSTKMNELKALLNKYIIYGTNYQLIDF